MLRSINSQLSTLNPDNRMCGIAGQFNFQRREPVERETIVRMAHSIAHRGPDDEGFFIAGPIGLGFRRLSIIDLAGGHQPMSDAEQTVWIIFNGEIYNYKELRAELQSKGHQFRTNCDTEVIIHGYKQWGTDVFNHLNGMFGLAIWDVPNERLVVARDAMGIKLVYYKIDDGRLTFGSEIRAVLAADDTSPQVDASAVNLFLRFRYTPSPYTIFKGVRKLAPGMLLVVEKGRCREKRWYNFVPTPFATPKKDEDAVAELLDLYKAAVRRHLLSDVPVGILLSGGLDSGLLLALMNEHGNSWPAYTIGYGRSFSDDELFDAAETASLLGARHVTVMLDRNEFERSLPGIVECLEEPVAASSIVPMYFVSQRARQDVKVVLIGQGPDELFGGYKRHLGVHYGDWWRGLPVGLRSMIGSAIDRLPRNETLKRGVKSLGNTDRLRRYQDVFSLAPAETINGLFREDVPETQDGELVENWHALRPQMEHTDELGGFQLLEIRSSLPDELLMYADKLSMAHSLEARVPYLDRTVVEYVQRLGANLKVRNGTRKWLHRSVCQKYLPPRIMKRKKRGFAVNVVDEWFHSSLKGDLPEALLDETSLMFDLLKPASVRKLLDAHRSRRQDNHKLLFSLVMLEQWLRRIRSRKFPQDESLPVGREAVGVADSTRAKVLRRD
jgi:asparagine synthase (glutamine-hydrolysing)